MIILVVMEMAPFKIYNASAGSGKTFTLVKEYLKVCLGSSSPHKFFSILAVTFTNKAAGEMKERVLTCLKAFSNPSCAGQTELDMMNAISSEMDIEKRVLQARSQLVFETILHRYSRFSIGTIDKFTHRVLKTFAHDLGLPSNFDVEIEQSILIKQAVDLLISRAGNDDELTRLFVSFIKTKTDDDKSWLIENDFYVVAEELLKESGQKHCEMLETLSLDQLFHLKKGLEAYIANIDLKLSTIGKSFAKYCRENEIELKWVRGGVKSGLPKYFEYLETKNWEKYVPSQSNQASFERDDWCSSSVPAHAKSKITALKEKFAPLVKSCYETLEGYPKYISFKLFDRNLFSVGVLREISKEMSRIKDLNNIIPIGEFNKKIAEVLQKEEGDFIYERLGERYSNYFIDEFQDTSMLQWNNLTPLIENAIADGLKPGSAMIVGDAKQAIYRWRGGNVDQFVDLQTTAQDTSKQQAYRMKYLSLQKNYRSKEEIVRFNNELFSSISKQISSSKYAHLFENINAQEEKGPGGFVSLEYFEAALDSEDQQLARCLSLVCELKLEGFLNSDICVLTRTKAKGALVVKALSDENIPVISSESLLLEQSTEVRFILNFLRFINEPNHPFYRFKIIEFLEVGALASKLTNEYIKHLCTEKEGDFYLFLNELIGGFELTKWRGLPLLSLCHKISRSFGLEEKAAVYVQFFLDEVWDYGNKHSQDLFGFLNYWEERSQKMSVAIPEQTNAVRVMTIHKSKGLEFPVVLFPFANWDATTERDAKSWVEVDDPELAGLPATLIPLNKKLCSSTTKLQSIYEDHQSRVVLDNLNMLYVALTRAKTRLHVFTSNKEKKKNLNLYFDHFLKEKGLWVEGKKEYVFGEKVAPKNVVIKENNHFRLSPPLSDLSAVLKVSRGAPRIWDVDKPELGSDRGKKVHLVLSYIKLRGDLNLAMKKAKRKGLITDADKKELQPLIEELLAHPKMTAYFEPGLRVKNEEEILLSNGKVIRPDRLVFDEEKVTIIDYKTGRYEDDHVKQVEQYRDALKRMNYTNIVCVLAYVNEDTVVVKKF